MPLCWYTRLVRLQRDEGHLRRYLAKAETGISGFRRGIRWGFCAALVLSAIAVLVPATSHAKYASIVVDAKTGKISHGVNENTRNYPASLTKLMTLYLLFEAVDTGKLTMDTRLAVSRRAANQPASRLGLKPGQSIKVGHAILALVVKSANDVASVVAEALGGSERRFALIMTDKARKLGMSRTTFRNASGLPHRGQMSTAKDMATLTRRIISHFPRYYHFFSKKSFAFQGRTYRTHNKVLKYYPGAEGMKTGYIRASGYNLITTVKRDGQRLVGVVFGGNTSRARDKHMRSLLDRSFKRLGTARIAKGRSATPKKSVKTAKLQPRRKSSAKPSTKSSAKPGESIWGIQVGAFYTHRPAAKLAGEVSKKYARSLGGGGRITIMPLKKARNPTLYRARILGIGKKRAYRTCRLLKKHRKPCLELRLPATIELAAR